MRDFGLGLRQVSGWSSGLRSRIRKNSDQKFCDICYTKLINALVFLLVGLLFGSAVMAQESTNPPGLAIGKKSPRVVLNDQNGNKQDLSQMLKEGPVAVVFHRSADW